MRQRETQPGMYCMMTVRVLCDDTLPFVKVCSNDLAFSLFPKNKAEIH